MADARDIVERYLSALYGGDARAARRHLADDFSFSGPAVSLSDPDQYLQATQHAVRAARRVETRKVFVDGPDACIFYELHLDHPVGCVPIAEWYHLDGDQITAIRTILDTSPFTSTKAMAGETAVDPVRGMTVGMGSAATTRTFAERTYFFCNPGCAEAFDAQPERYIATTR